MLKLLGNMLSKVREFNRAEDCQRSFLRQGCGDCVQVFRWMPRVTGFGDTQDSKMATLIRSILEIDDETLCLFCDACWKVEIVEGESPTDWIDRLTCACLCMVGARMGFPCNQCLPGQKFSLCGASRHVYLDCQTDAVNSYSYGSDTLSPCIGCGETSEPYVFDTCDDDSLYKRFLKALFISKTSNGTADDLFVAASTLFPDDTVEIVDNGLGRAWISLGRALTDLERRMRTIFASVLPIPVGVSFRILEPECSGALPAALN